MEIERGHDQGGRGGQRERVEKADLVERLDVPQQKAVTPAGVRRRRGDEVDDAGQERCESGERRQRVGPPQPPAAALQADAGPPARIWCRAPTASCRASPWRRARAPPAPRATSSARIRRRRRASRPPASRGWQARGGTRGSCGEERRRAAPNGWRSRRSMRSHCATDAGPRRRAEG
jgi:hypothetical protein